MTSKELRQKRAKLIADAQAIIHKDGATTEEMAQADAMLAEVDSLYAQIERVERADKLALESGLAASSAVSPGARGVVLPFSLARENDIAARMVHHGVRFADLPGDDRDYVTESLAREKRIIRGAALAAFHGVPLTAYVSEEDAAHYRSRFAAPASGFQAAGNEASSTAGGYTVAPLFEAELLIALKAFGNVRGVAKVITTATGATLPWPTMDDTANVATILATENTSVGSGTDLVFGQTSLGAYTYVSGVMPVSVQLLQDSVFDFDSLIRNAMGMRFARGQNAHYTTGTSIGQPQGVVTAAASGKVGATGQTLTVIYDDLIDLYHSVDPAYRANGRFMMHDSSVQVIRKLKDTQGHPLWQPSLQAGMPDNLLGLGPVEINQQMPVMAANAKSILYGDFSNYIVRDTLGLQMIVLRERYADLLQVAWNAYMRTDGRMISAASPIKYYANSAT